MAKPTLQEFLTAVRDREDKTGGITAGKRINQILKEFWPGKELDDKDRFVWFKQYNDLLLNWNPPEKKIKIESPKSIWNALETMAKIECASPRNNTILILKWLREQTGYNLAQSKALFDYAMYKEGRVTSNIYVEGYGQTDPANIEIKFV